MEKTRKVVDTQALMETYRELLPRAEFLPLVVSGSSMTPFLVHHRDTVYLAAVREPLRVGDIVLYQRDDGSYILHRICRVRGNVFDLIGDAHTVIERSVRRDQIFARVIRAERKGKKQAPGCFWWEFFRIVWVRLIPMRPLLRRLYGKVCLNKGE